MYTDYENKPRRPIAARAKRIFVNVSIMCLTSIVIAVTVKVILSIFGR
jgi:hypothetical protein